MTGALPLVAPEPDAAVECGVVPTFSVVIPAYEASAFIAAAVESALAQTVAPHEVIVCDDGSTDDLEEALVPYRDRLIVRRGAHRGAGAARNEGIRLASGEFVALLDADDVFEPNRLEALGELAAARPDLDLLGTDAWFDVDGRMQERFYDSTDFAQVAQRSAILDRCFIAWPALRRARVLDVGGFDEETALAPAEDWDLFLRLILSGSKAGIVDLPLMRYRRHSASMTADRVRALRARVHLLEKARSHPSLTALERTELEFYLRRARSRALLEEALLLPGQRRARHELLRLSAASGAVRPSARLALAAAALAPRAARRPLLSRQARRVAGACWRR